MIKEEQLIEQKELRDNYVEKIEVLDKVEGLLLIQQTDTATIKQIADFYQVGEEAIKTIYMRHQDELNKDGVVNKSYKDFLKFQDATLEMSKGKAVFLYKNGEVLTVPMRGLKVFPRRAILRIGMLLRDSEIAKRVRTALLDIEEKTSDEIKVQDINEEKSLMYNIVDKCLEGKTTETIAAISTLMDFKNRHIKKQEEHIDKLKRDNKALTGEILTWKDRAKMNHAIRKLAGLLHKQIGVVWNDLYQNLYYQYSISVKARGDSPYIQHIKENEWEKVIKTFSAMCTSNNISPSEIFNSVNTMTEVSTNA